MTMFEHVPPLHTRALSMPHMREMLETLHAASLALHDSTPVYLIWRRISTTTGRDTKSQQAHISAAREAGFIEEIPGSGSMAVRVRITDAGREAIGAEAPFWRVCA
jgi:hypothetical protein